MYATNHFILQLPSFFSSVPLLSLSSLPLLNSLTYGHRRSKGQTSVQSRCTWAQTTNAGSWRRHSLQETQKHCQQKHFLFICSTDGAIAQSHFSSFCITKNNIQNRFDGYLEGREEDRALCFTNAWTPRDVRYWTRQTKFGLARLSGLIICSSSESSEHLWHAVSDGSCSKLIQIIWRDSKVIKRKAQSMAICNI